MTRCSWTAALLLAGAAAVANAQSLLVVNVGEAPSGAFVQDALIRLPDIGRVARTNWRGEARVADLAPGDYRVQVRKLGYAPSEVTLRITRDTASAYFALERAASQLDTVRVYAAPYTAQMQYRAAGVGPCVVLLWSKW